MENDSFRELAEAALQDLFEQLDEYGQFEVDLVDGVLMITLEDDREYVVNRHIPSQQLWLASPVSGPHYFSYDDLDERWLSQDGEGLVELISEELEVPLREQ